MRKHDMFTRENKHGIFTCEKITVANWLHMKMAPFDAFPKMI